MIKKTVYPLTITDAVIVDNDITLSQKIKDIDNNIKNIDNNFKFH